MNPWFHGHPLSQFASVCHWQYKKSYKIWVELSLQIILRGCDFLCRAALGRGAAARWGRVAHM